MKKAFSYTSISLAVGFLFVIMFLSSCKTNTKTKEQKTKSANNKELDVKQEINNNVSALVYPLPTSVEITEMLNNNGISFMIGATNNLDNVSRYFTSNSKAYNIGIYGADLSYVGTYQMTQETMLYLKAINQLGNELGISSIYNETLLNRIQDNVNNKDTLVEVISTTILDTYDFLNKNGKADLSLLMVSGGFVEGLYLSTNSSSISGSNAELNKIIYSQKSSLEKLLEILDSRNGNGNFTELIADLSIIKKIFNEVQNDTMTPDQVSNMAVAVEKVRNKMIT